MKFASILRNGRAPLPRSIGIVPEQLERLAVVVAARDRTEVVDRPVGKDRLTNDAVDIDKPERPGVLAVPPIIAENIDHPVGDGNSSKVAGGLIVADGDRAVDVASRRVSPRRRRRSHCRR